MLTKSILTAIAIALVAGLGSASAGEQFSTLESVQAEALDIIESDRVRATSIIVSDIDGNGLFKIIKVIPVDCPGPGCVFITLFGDPSGSIPCGLNAGCKIVGPPPRL